MRLLQNKTKYLYILLLILINIFVFRQVFINYDKIIYYGDIDPIELNAPKYIDDALYTIYPYNGTGATKVPNLPTYVLSNIYQYMGSFLPVVLLNKLLLILYIILCPVIIYNFLEKFLYSYGLLAKHFAVFACSFFYINNYIIDQLFLYPLSYLYLPLLFIPLLLWMYLADNRPMFFVFALICYILIGTSQVMILVLLMIALFVAIDSSFRTKKFPAYYLVLISGLFFIYVAPFILFYFIRDDPALNRELTKAVIKSKAQLLFADSWRLFFQWFTTDSRSIDGALFPRNYYNLFKNNIFFALLSFAPVILFIYSYSKLKSFNKPLRLFLLALLGYFLLFYIFFHGITTGTVIDEVFRGSDKYSALLLFILTCLLAAGLASFYKKIVLTIFIIILCIYNIKIFDGLIIEEVFTDEIMKKPEISKMLSGKRVIYLPLIEKNSWIAIRNKFLAYSPYPIMYNTISFNSNIPNSNADINDVYDIDPSDYTYQIDEKKLDQVLEKYDIEYIIFYKNFSYAYYYIPDSERQIIESLNRYRLVHQDSDIMIFETSQNREEVLSGASGWFQKINSIKYKIYLQNIEAGTDLIFRESYNKGWSLYLKRNPNRNWCENMEATEKLTDCGTRSGFMDYSDLSHIYDDAIFSQYNSINNHNFNKWIIDPDYIESNYSQDYYRRNSDGSMDIELILFFKPQSYYYVNLGIFIIFVLANCAYLVLKRNNNEK